MERISSHSLCIYTELYQDGITFETVFSDINRDQAAEDLHTSLAILGEFDEAYRGTYSRNAGAEVLFKHSWGRAPSAALHVYMHTTPSAVHLCK